MNMKILLNLLPENKQRDVQRRLHFRFFLWQLFLVFTLEIFYLVILVGIYFIFDFQLRGLEKSAAQANAEYSEQRILNKYQEKFKETNALVDTINKINRSHFSFTQIFLLLDAIVPESIAIERLTTKEYTVMLVGQAATREDFLVFDARLKESECVKNVTMPLSNLFSQDNIEFQVDFEIFKECLQKNHL